MIHLIHETTSVFFSSNFVDEMILYQSTAQSLFPAMTMTGSWPGLPDPDPQDLPALSMSLLSAD